MQNPFDALGLTRDANAEQVRAAYHARVKLCHPDCVRDETAQQRSQRRRVQGACAPAPPASAEAPALPSGEAAALPPA